MIIEGISRKAPDRGPRVSVRQQDGSVREMPFDRLRLAHFAGSVPWRQARSVRGQTHFPGRYASVTTGGQVIYESRLELARLLLADQAPEVCQIFAQPFLVTARIEGRVRRHVPDFLLVTRAGAVQVVNVKPAARLEDPKIVAALAWPGELVCRHGWAYEVWSGAERALVENIRFLAAYRRPGVVPVEDVEQAWASVVDGEQMASAEQRLAAGRPGHEVRPALGALLWSGRLTTDLSRPLGGTSVLYKAVS
uniref:TnsA-like heteromeric transposase endonuclease subunit n=1 Tax=Streptomyces sp. NBC_00003 TaxID=2903608 RepID=A0AAU2VC80_9ACTN